MENIKGVKEKSTMNQSNSSREDYAVMANRIAAVLSETPMTAAEINATLGKEYTPLQIANAVKCISGAAATKVRRMVRNTRGFQVEKEYAAYSLNGSGAVQRPQQHIRSQRNSTPKPSISNAEYQEMAKAIAAVLSHEPMTAAEINAALGKEYSPLQISNAVKCISGAAATKVRRMTRNTKGFQMEKEYAAYYFR